MSVYLDTSVVVAALTKESATARIQHYIAQIDVGALLVSDWVVTEFASALAMKTRTGYLGIDDRRRASDAFDRLLLDSFVRLSVRAADFSRAADLVASDALGLRAADALHLAIADRVGAELLTLDRKLAGSAAALGMRARVI
ncbi:type II toxin-antitoxin system VapC family toxin [Salinarimonas sp. NSM]|uniref:type II toxin-antitoxin system VapC family toxin n=1 Tax=Salinarimonas sp. NSM TaxID=3458003 RepID=UPI0040365CF8